MNKTDPIVLDKIPVNLNLERVLERLKLRNNSERLRSSIQELVDMVIPVARPKAVYRISRASTKDRKTLILDGVEFTSYVPTLDFGDGERVFTYVVTCGTEVDAIKTSPGDFMKHFCLNIIKEVVLRGASEYFTNHLKETYGVTELTRVGPGEALGPLVQQRKLFAVIGDVEKAIGVRLSPHNLMVPEKSNSGFFFETRVKLESCQLCPDAKCKGRRAPYSPEEVKKARMPVTSP